VTKTHPLRVTLLAALIAFGLTALGQATPQARLKRAVMPKRTATVVPSGVNSDVIVFKLAEGIGRPAFDGKRFDRGGPQWDRLNAAIATNAKAAAVRPRFDIDLNTLDQMRAAGSVRLGAELPDLSLYRELHLPAGTSNQDKLNRLNELLYLDIVEAAYFAPKPSPASFMNPPTFMFAETNSPGWEANQYYLQPAPTGVDAYYAWNYPGGKGEGVKVIDIEGNWIQTHEDLHGGTDNFHIAGSRINDPGWYNHGTAVLGEIAADSNDFGMTGIAFNVDLGTISIGSMSTANALLTAINNSDTGDVFLIELHAPGPHYDFQDRQDQAGYVCMEYWQETFDVILSASSLGRIVVEAAGNGNENFDDAGLYGSLFDSTYRYSGAVIVGASSASHVPASFSNYGARVDVHGFGTWDVFTLGYGDLYGSSDNNHYTAQFSGTSSASPIVTGSCAALQGIHKATYGRILDYTDMHNLLISYGTPQASSYKHIGPLPNLAAAVDQMIGVSFFADTTFGWVPFDVAFTGASALQVDSWLWDFGDGQSSTEQSPVHTYQAPGMHTVELQVTSGGDIRTAQRNNFVVALADSITAASVDGYKGQEVVVSVRAHNSVPLTSITVPVEYGGAVGLVYDSFSTVGCRTDYFEYQQRIHSDGNNQRQTIRLNAATLGNGVALPPGEGDILKLYFKVPAGASYSAVSDIVLDGYLSFLPAFNGSIIDFTPLTLAGSVGICVPHGDVDGLNGVTVADVTYLVNFLFAGGFPPYPLEAGDVDCSGATNVSDLTHLVAYLFQGGLPPCGC